ncbi:MAG: tetratricopeptide repeat protein [Persicimonas sp.]
MVSPSAPSKPSKPTTWQGRFAQAVTAGEKAKRRDPEGALGIWLDGWSELDENLPAEVDTIDAAQEALGDDEPSIHNWVWDVVNIFRGLVNKNKKQAAEQVAFMDALFERFSGESDHNWRSLEAERAYFLGQAGDFEQAVDICLRQIADYPEEARGYCVLADIYRSAEPPQPERALEVLEQGTAYPVADPDDWDLPHRLDEVRRQVEQKQILEHDDYIEWDTFWDEFDEADLDTQFEMARDRIDNAPDFDEEWAFSLMIDGLLTPTIRSGRGEEWLELLERLREKRPEQVDQEANVLGATAVDFALMEDGEYLDTSLELLFANPSQAADHIFHTLERLAYHGVTSVLDHLLEAWPRFRDAHVMPHAFGEWADWTVLAQVAAWAEEDIDQPRTMQHIRAALGGMLEEAESGGVEPFVTFFLGSEPARYDADAEKSRDKEVDPAQALCLAFARSLVDDHGWPPFKALLAGRYLVNFVRYGARCKDPFSCEYCTPQATRDKTLRRELKELRELWREDYRFAPHPDLAVGYTNEIRKSDFFGSPHKAATFFEATARLAPWLEERGFIQNPELTTAIQHHLARRTPEVADSIKRDLDQDPLLEQNLEETAQWLKSHDA